MTDPRTSPYVFQARLSLWGKLTDDPVPLDLFAALNLPARVLILHALIGALQSTTPEYAGAVDIYQSEKTFGAAIEAILEGDMYVTGKLATSCLEYGFVARKPRILLRVLCLDPAASLLIEADSPAPVDVGANRGEWDDSDFETHLFVAGPSAKAVRDHPVFQTVVKFCDLDPVEVDELIANNPHDPNGISPLRNLQHEIEEEVARSLQDMEKVTRKAEKHFAVKLKEAGKQAQRDQKKLSRLNESLTQQLATARATAQRNNDRATGLERQLRERNTGASAATPPAPNEPNDSEIQQTLNDQLAQKDLEVEQLAATVDDLRAQLHRYRSAEASASEKTAAPPPLPPIPDTFDVLPAWIAAHLPAGRLMIHPKAIRAARKSVYRDVPLVYRCLKAMHDWYYPMVMQGDAKAGKQWEDFLQRERLRCGPTGDAVDAHRTAESYHISFQGHRYPLDTHLQGSSSRKEQDALRIYYHVSKKLQRILIGSFPGHLSNTHS